MGALKVSKLGEGFALGQPFYVRKTYIDCIERNADVAKW
jgi:hypothetical protein